MIEKLQQVGHDMGSLVGKQHIHHGRHQTLGLRTSASDLPGISPRVMQGSGHTAVGGHPHTAAHTSGSWPPAPP